MKILSALLASTNHSEHSSRLRGSVVILVLRLPIKLVGFFTILIAPNLTGQQTCLEEAQLIERFVNHQTSS